MFNAGYERDFWRNNQYSEVSD